MKRARRRVRFDIERLLELKKDMRKEIPRQGARDLLTEA
jgi:hypothetical protein